MNKLTAEQISTLTDVEQKSIHKLKERVSEIFHLQSLILFGSKARGDFEDSSDVDVLVLVEEEKDWHNQEKLSDITFEINMKYDTQLTCILENCRNWETEDEGIWLPLKDNISREGIVIEI
ncbi:nucleotidyltransferase family protein [Paenibacillus thalictri]|uniref:Nucleotidyltransferase domain-containing protein n=1 Tax=Paenibacillus thalictri TaxID=2527873 RepID=A0A4Q9DIN0_9BACL|nr:nucleotidyltransferase domain-containing protein [Paenibacillus thalictri]TBL70111.1 nucleotidyltransferase domain-containing protein [Paenibacillus thalictri]